MLLLFDAKRRVLADHGCLSGVSAAGAAAVSLDISVVDVVEGVFAITTIIIEKQQQ